jgi:hypothetical protein
MTTQLAWTQRSERWYFAVNMVGTTYHIRMTDSTEHTATWTLTTQPVACDTHTEVEASPKLEYLMNLAQWMEDSNERR